MRTPIWRRTCAAILTPMMALAFVSALTTATAATPSPAAVSITKSVDVSYAQPGQVVTFTLTVTNSGGETATSVHVRDDLPDGLTLQSATGPGCPTVAADPVLCEVGTLTPGASAVVTIKALVGPVPSGSDHSHDLVITKLETHLSVPAGETRVAEAVCPADSLAVDGSVRIDHIDQDTGTLADVVVLGSQAVWASEAWRGTVRNDTTGQAQVKVNVVCLSRTTTRDAGHTHAIGWLGDAIVDTSPPYSVICPAGTPAAPSFLFTATHDSGTPVPAVGSRYGGSRFSFQVVGGTTHVSVRCLDTSLDDVAGHSHRLTLVGLQRFTTVAPGAVLEEGLTCPVGYKGVVGWSDHVFEDGPALVSLGNDPQPITRVFRWFNPSTVSLYPTFGLVCLRSRVGGGVLSNVAWVYGANDATPGDNYSGADLGITASGVTIVSPRVQLSGSGAHAALRTRLASTRARTVTTRLVSTSAVPGTGIEAGDVLARTSTTLVSGTQAVHLHARVGEVSKALLRGDLTTARLVVVNRNGVRTVREVSIVR